MALIGFFGTGDVPLFHYYSMVVQRTFSCSTVIL